MQSHLDDLDAEVAEQAGYKKPPEKTMIEKKIADIFIMA